VYPQDFYHSTAMSDLKTYKTVPVAEAKTPPRGRKLVIAAAAAVSFCLGAGVAVQFFLSGKVITFFGPDKRKFISDNRYR